MFAVQKHYVISPLLWAMLLISPLAQTQTQTGIADDGARVIVKYKSDSSLLRKRTLSVEDQHASQAQELGARVGLELHSGAGLAEQTHVLFAHGITSEQLAQRLAAESDVEYAVPDERRHHFLVPNDPLYQTGPPSSASAGGPVVGQWYLRAPLGEVQSSINVEPAWDMSAGGSTVVVAVIDTGVRFDHQDLKPVAAGGKLLPGYDMISDVPTANDGDGRDADPGDPGDWLTLSEVRQRSSPFYGCATTGEDSSWHGTQTSGLIGALTNNGTGMASVVRTLRVLPVRVLGKCGGYDSDIIAGMRWAAGMYVPGVPTNRNPARVLNLSLGGSGRCNAAYRDALAAINALGDVVVAAAGNSTGHAVGSPANCPGVIAVAGLRHVGTKVGYSDLGPDISVSAPAGNCVNTAADAPCLYPILTTANSGLTAPLSDAAGGSIYTDSFNASLGTSFSAPLVAGTAALMLSVHPTLAPTDVRRLLQATARSFPTTGGDNGDGTPVPQCILPQPIGSSQIDQLQCYCTTLTCGAGMLDAGAAILAALAAQTSELTITKSGRGTVTSSPAGIKCGSVCSGSFPVGTAVTLVATPDPDAPGGNYTFVGWGGACAGFGAQPICTLTMNTAQNASAAFNYVGTGSTTSREYMQNAYAAYYGRPADPVGLTYWALRMDAEGRSQNSIIQAFGTSTEFSNRYGGLSYMNLVTAIFRQVLGREPDPAGLNYYLTELLAARKSLQTIALDVLNGATGPIDSATVANKLNVANYYTSEVANGCPYGTANDGVNALLGVSGDPATVASAKIAIDTRCGP